MTTLASFPFLRRQKPEPIILSRKVKLGRPLIYLRQEKQNLVDRHAGSAGLCCIQNLAFMNASMSASGLILAAFSRLDSSMSISVGSKNSRKTMKEKRPGDDPTTYLQIDRMN